jgi:Zn-dependent protease
MQDPAGFFVVLLAILLALTIHEYAHAKFADMAGDPTPRYFGRVTLNPLSHLDPFGTLLIIFTMIAGFGIGYGKPVPMDPSKMRNPRWDHFAAVAAGPLSNLLQAVIYAGIIRAITRSGAPMESYLGQFLFAGVLVNISLLLFNLIPLGPLDGHWLLGSFMPDRMRDRWYLWNRTTGTFLMLGLVLIGQLTALDPLSRILVPSASFLLRLLLGQ